MGDGVKVDALMGHPLAEDLTQKSGDTHLVDPHYQVSSGLTAWGNGQGFGEGLVRSKRFRTGKRSEITTMARSEAGVGRRLGANDRVGAVVRFSLPGNEIQVQPARCPKRLGVSRHQKAHSC